MTLPSALSESIALLVGPTTLTKIVEIQVVSNVDDHRLPIIHDNKSAHAKSKINH